MSRDVDGFSGSIKDTALAIREAIGVHIVAVTTAYSPRAKVAAVAFEVGQELSQLCRLVCLVDCELIDPALADTMAGIRDVEDVLIDAKARHSESYVIFAGTAAPVAAVNAQQFKTTIARFTELADVIILDTPPFTDHRSHDVLQMADAVIIVVPPGAPTGADASSGQLTFRITGTDPEDSALTRPAAERDLEISLFGESDRSVLDVRAAPPTVWTDRSEREVVPPADVSFGANKSSATDETAKSGGAASRWRLRRRSPKKDYLD